MRRIVEQRAPGRPGWRGACVGLAVYGVAAVLGCRVLAQEQSSTPPPTATTATENAAAKDYFDLSLEQIKQLSVSGAAKHEQSISDAPSSVTILTADEIKKSGYRTLADALDSVPGFYVSYDRNRSFLGVRGFNRDDFNSRILLLVDGHRVNNNLSDSAFLGTDFILDVDLIDKIEVIRGPGSVLYGDNAFFGVVNIQTRRGGGLKSWELSGEYGSFDAYKGRVTYGNSSTNGFEFLVSGSLFDSQGPDRLYYREFDSPLTNNGIARRRDDDDFKEGFASFRFKDFTLEGAYSKRDKGDPTAPFGSAFDTSKTRNIDERGYANFRFEHDFPDDLNVMAQIYYDRYTLEGDLFYTDPQQLIRDDQVGEWWGAEAQVRKKLFDRHTFTFGAEYRDDFRQDRRGYNNEVLFADQHGTRESYGVFLQNELTLAPKLLLNAGARYDWYSTFGETFNPRVALILKPWESTAFKAIGGTAFRGPDFFETLFNSSLQPETITTYELVYEQRFLAHWRSELSLYYNEIDDLISFRNNTYENIKGADAKGVELALNGNWTNGLATRLSYTYQETRDAETRALLTDSPRHLAKANVTVPVYNQKLFANLEADYTSSRVTLLGNRASGLALFNFTLFSRELLKGLEVSGSVYNLLDKRYSDPATPFHLQDLIEQNGRTFRVKVTYRF